MSTVTRKCGRGTTLFAAVTIVHRVWAGRRQWGKCKAAKGFVGTSQRAPVEWLRGGAINAGIQFSVVAEQGRAARRRGVNSSPSWAAVVENATIKSCTTSQQPLSGRCRGGFRMCDHNRSVQWCLLWSRHLRMCHVPLTVDERKASTLQKTLVGAFCIVPHTIRQCLLIWSPVGIWNARPGAMGSASMLVVAVYVRTEYGGLYCVMLKDKGWKDALLLLFQLRATMGHWGRCRRGDETRGRSNLPAGTCQKSPASERRKATARRGAEAQKPVRDGSLGKPHPPSALPACAMASHHVTAINVMLILARKCLLHEEAKSNVASAIDCVFSAAAGRRATPFAGLECLKHSPDVTHVDDRQVPAHPLSCSLTGRQQAWAFGADAYVPL
ncbi:hypothetical protein Micbo1qcDRAFT_173814 [Microdochium bolleyi]|uniref:Uncharacterized protein n=1 Tax=Microdochium bolleyi TaxID=196109 RepID=A0A136J621_9PEZI|nr:hypothetical protein Micbo1qcDRAFT_173814 [Microdochium bolleyi]